MNVTTINKNQFSEDDISVKYITPAIINAGWDEAAHIRRQVSFTKGRIIVRGKLVSRGRPKQADFVLYYQHIPLAVIEAKKSIFSAAHGMQQALDYASALNAPFVFSSNGKGFVYHDRTGILAQGEVDLSMEQFPSPDSLWCAYRTKAGIRASTRSALLRLGGTSGCGGFYLTYLGRSHCSLQ